MLVQGTEACDDFFLRGTTAKLMDKKKGLDLELGWAQGKGKEPSVQEQHGRGIRHGQYWLKLEGQLFDELESVPPQEQPLIQRLSSIVNWDGRNK